MIATKSVGLNHIDLEECARRNIPVGYTPDVLTDAVAEATIALTLATARRHKEGDIVFKIFVVRGMLWSFPVLMLSLSVLMKKVPLQLHQQE